MSKNPPRLKTNQDLKIAILYEKIRSTAHKLQSLAYFIGRHTGEYNDPTPLNEACTGVSLLLIECVVELHSTSTQLEHLELQIRKLDTVNKER